MWLFLVNADKSFSIMGKAGPFLQEAAAAASVKQLLIFTGRTSTTYNGSVARTVDIPDTLSDLSDGIWKAGNTLTISNSLTPFSGIVTNSTKDIRILVPVGKPIASNVSATVTALSGTLRGVEGYIDGSEDINFVSNAAYTPSAIISNAGAGLVTLLIRKNAAFTNVTNNTVISLLARTMTLRFDAASGDESMDGPEVEELGMMNDE